MQDLGKLGVWYAADKLEPAQWVDFVQHVETLGYGTLWHSESAGFEAMSFGAFLLNHTSRLNIGSAIANIYARDAISSKNGMQTLNRISDNRYVLGLGVSHIPLVEKLRGHSYKRPVATMRAYLESMSAGQDDADDWPVIIAALGPRMLELSASHCRGCLPYNVTPEHTARAREIVGPDAIVAVEQKVCLEPDSSQALTYAKRELERYMALPNYRNNWLSLGFTEGDLANGGSERFLNAMVVWGDAETIAARVQAHRDAGATHVSIQPVHAEGDVESAKTMLTELASI